MARKFIKTKNEKDVLVVDGLNLAFRYLHNNTKEFANTYIQTLKSLAQSYSCGRIIIAADKGSSTYRKNIDPEYKGNRKVLREKQTEEEAQDFTDFIQEFENTILQVEELEGYPVLRFQGIEADDIAAYIVKHREDLGINNIKLISSDKDWSLLLNDNVSQFSTVTRKEYSLDTWSTHYDFDHELFLTFKCLTGDKSDNIPGISGIGPKRATALMEEYGNVFDIYEACPLPGKQKFIQNLNNNYEQLLVNIELMHLLEYCDEILENYNDEINEKIMEYI
jgi:5'-3' exonuclease